MHPLSITSCQTSVSSIWPSLPFRFVADSRPKIIISLARLDTSTRRKPLAELSTVNPSTASQREVVARPCQTAEIPSSCKRDPRDRARMCIRSSRKWQSHSWHFAVSCRHRSSVPVPTVGICTITAGIARFLLRVVVKRLASIARHHIHTMIRRVLMRTKVWLSGFMAIADKTRNDVKAHGPDICQDWTTSRKRLLFMVFNCSAPCF